MALIDHFNDFIARFDLPITRERPPMVAVLRLKGVIGAVGLGGRGLSVQSIEPLVRRAFSRRVRAVVLIINSPGGSAVQSAQLTQMIRAASRDKRIPVLAFTEDVAASGGYWLALAGDEIYADPMSIVGSIGVIAASFGAHELLAKIGVERRIYTAGDRKSLLDPFRPIDPKDVERLTEIQAEIHRGFIAAVKDRRALKLNGADDVLFNGDIWTGEKAKELGLVDGLGDYRAVCKRKYGDDVRFMAIDRPMSWLQRRLGRFAPPDIFAGEAGDGWAGQLIAAVEERSWWSRFGL
ncbi:MAG: S49 family peptidase [Alphaproteobacteria bacterium]|nr:S49 family peptidase [Alphaproteobacteria bacterium]